MRKVFPNRVKEQGQMINRFHSHFFTVSMRKVTQSKARFAIYGLSTCLSFARMLVSEFRSDAVVTVFLLFFLSFG
jgi:hypothetical protein